jgi:hypothetical protein
MKCLDCDDEAIAPTNHCGKHKMQVRMKGEKVRIQDIRGYVIGGDDCPGCKHDLDRQPREAATDKRYSVT